MLQETLETVDYFLLGRVNIQGLKGVSFAQKCIGQVHVLLRFYISWTYLHIKGVSTLLLSLLRLHYSMQKLQA